MMDPIASFDVACLKPVPWSTPQVFMKTTGAGRRYKSAARNPELETWQSYVKLHAEEAMGDRPPVLGPLRVDLVFYRQTDDPELVGSEWFNGVAWSEKKETYVKTGETVPDVDNLAKGVLDAMQGVVFGNDVQVCVLETSRLFWSYDGVSVRVHELRRDGSI
jgi:Holliday junction resolvase RusA-like endonuclease